MSKKYNERELLAEDRIKCNEESRLRKLREAFGLFGFDGKLSQEQIDQAREHLGKRLVELGQSLLSKRFDQPDQLYNLKVLIEWLMGQEPKSGRMPKEELDAIIQRERIAMDGVLPKNWENGKISPHVVKDWLEYIQRERPGQSRYRAPHHVAVNCACGCRKRRPENRAPYFNLVPSYRSSMSSYAGRPYPNPPEFYYDQISGKRYSPQEYELKLQEHRERQEGKGVFFVELKDGQFVHADCGIPVIEE